MLSEDIKEGIPFFARYSTKSKNLEKQFDTYHCPGINSYRDNHLRKVNKTFSRDNQIPDRISLENLIPPDVIKNSIPNICAAGPYIVYPNIPLQSFFIQNILTGKQSSFQVEDIRQCSEIVFDGLFFNVLCANKLYRFRFRRDDELYCLNPFFFTDELNIKKIYTPLFLEFKNTRILSFMVNETIYLLNLSQKDTIKSTYLVKNLEMDEKFIPLVYDGSKNIYIITNKGNVYILDLEEKKIIPKGNFNRFDKIGYPVYFDNSVNLLIKNNNNISRIKINDEIKRKDYIFEYLNDIDFYPLVHKNIFILKYTDYLFYLAAVREEQVRSNINCDLENFFCIDNSLFILGRDNVFEYSLEQNRIIRNIPYQIKAEEKLLGDILYLNGLILIFTSFEIKILKTYL